MKNKTIAVLIVFTSLFLTFSCKDKAEAEKEERQAYLEENNITVSPTSSGLYYIETQAGEGEQALLGKYVTVHYTGKFLNGTVFDSSIGGEPFEFQLGIDRVITGWHEGIALMKAGGKATLIIPSELAYGTYGYASIPGYTTLVFDVELLEVN